MKIMLSAGEVSGDVHGTYLVRELKKLNPHIYFFGLGSEKLLAEGVDVKFDLTKRGTIGLIEALPNIIPIYIIYRRLIGLMEKERPDLLILIDSQGLNMPLAKAAKKLGIKTVYYIAPQEWLWGTRRGIKKVAETIDLIISIFEKEHQAYKQVQGHSVYFGHPLLDIVKPTMNRQEARSEFLGKDAGLEAGSGTPVISLCPGSRTQEIRGLFPILLAVGEMIQKEIPGARFIIPAASTEMIKMIFGLIGDFRPKAIVGHTYDILAASDLSICTSGTINLEASLLGIPNIMVYKLSPLTYFIGKYILKIGERLPFFSMPNILMEQKVIPELVMQQANPAAIAREAISILRNPSLKQQMKGSFSSLKIKLGSPGVISRVAQAILNFTS